LRDTPKSDFCRFVALSQASEEFQDVRQVRLDFPWGPFNGPCAVGRVRAVVLATKSQRVYPRAGLIGNGASVNLPGLRGEGVR
jgi:hypothetical protein